MSLICCQWSSNAICVCLASGMCAGSVTLGPFGGKRHMLLDCPILADLVNEFSQLFTDGSGVIDRPLRAMAGTS